MSEYWNEYEKLLEPSYGQQISYDYELLNQVNQNLEYLNENLDYVISELEPGDGTGYTF